MSRRGCVKQKGSLRAYQTLLSAAPHGEGILTGDDVGGRLSSQTSKSVSLTASHHIRPIVADLPLHPDWETDRPISFRVAVI